MSPQGNALYTAKAGSLLYKTWQNLIIHYLILQYIND